MWAQYFESPYEKLQNLLGMKFSTVSFSSRQWYIWDSCMSQVWTMKLTESTNTYHFSDRFARTINVNFKEIENSANSYLVNGLQSEKKRPITWPVNNGFLLLCPHYGKLLDLC